MWLAPADEVAWWWWARSPKRSPLGLDKHGICDKPSDNQGQSCFPSLPCVFFFVVLWELGEKEQVQTADAGDVSAFSTPPISRLPGSSMVPLIKLQKLSVTRDVACHKLQGKCIMSYQQIYFSVGTVFSWGCILLHLLFCRDHNCCFGPELVLAHLMEASWESLQSREMG